MQDNASVSHSRAKRDRTQIDEADPVDVASFDSFPASDAPAWIASRIGKAHAPATADARLASASANSQTS